MHAWPGMTASCVGREASCIWDDRTKSRMTCEFGLQATKAGDMVVDK